MKAVTQFVIRQSGWLLFFLLLFALLNGASVCEGLWQGSGLHGYILEPSAKGGSPRVVSTWAAFVEMLVFIGLAAVPLSITLRHWKERTE